MKRLALITATIILLLCIWHPAIAGDDGLHLLKPQRDFHVINVPETELVIVRDAQSWDTLVRFHFPNRNGEVVMGMAHKLTEKNKIRYIIYLPLFQSKFKNGIDFMETVGHEYLHIVDYSLGYKVFDPDRLEKTR